jgi:ribosomal protein S18 acetylase RimI-like enzyme
VGIVIRYKLLSREQALRYGESLLALGADNVWENWTGSNLLEPRPDKWLLSTFAIAEDNPVGYAIASRQGDAVHLHHLIIGREWRGRGIGRNLLRHLARKARATGASRLTLKVYKQNQQAAAFYQRLGFDIYGEVKEMMMMEASTEAICGEEIIDTEIYEPLPIGWTKNRLE